MPRSLSYGVLFGCVLVLQFPTLTAHADSESVCENRTVRIDYGGNGSSSRDQVFIDLALYTLNGLSPDKSCKITGTLTIECGRLDQRACDHIDLLANPTDYFDLRQFYQENHLRTVSVRKHDDYIKPTLAEFIAITHYETWPRHIVKRSAVKQKTRVVYRSPADFPHEISVSETRDTIEGDLNAQKLETEIAIRRHGEDRTYEFYAYNRQGDLVDYSEFPAGERPSPTICVSCHYNAANRSVSRFIPAR